MEYFKKKSRFWAIYGIVFGCLFALVLVFLAFFSDFIHNFEISQSLTSAEAFVDSLTDEDLSQLMEAAAAECGTVYSDRESVIRAFREKISLDTLILREVFTSNTPDKPVYEISSGGFPLYRITLTKGEKLKYGFYSWKTEKTESLLSVGDLETKTVHIYVPKGALLYANRIQVADAPTGTSAYRYFGKWDKANIFESDYYRINLLSEADFLCTLNGKKCELKQEEDGLYFLYPDRYLLSYTIEVPDIATVKVNDIPLTSEEISKRELPYDYPSVESTLDNLPSGVVYQIEGLTAEPTITAEIDGIPLPLTREENSFYGAYPEELKYSCTIRVPEGSTVLLHGIPLDAENITSKESESAELFSYSGSVPSFDIYTLDKLFLSPTDLEVLYNDLPLSFTHSAEGNFFTLSATYPQTNAPDTENLALSFLKDYFVYTSNGYLNTNANLSKVLTYIPYGCSLYWKMVQSENGFSWTSPVASMTYNTLEVTGVYFYPEGLRLCTIDFDISQTFYGDIYRQYSGTMMVLVNPAGQIVGMEIHANS